MTWTMMLMIVNTANVANIQFAVPAALLLKRLLLRNREGKLLSFWSNRGLRNRDVNRLFYWNNRDLRNRDVNNNFSWSSKDLKRKREDKQLFLPNSKLNNSQASQAH